MSKQIFLIGYDIIDTEMDDVRIYEIEDYGIALGTADLLEEMFIIK